MIYPVNIFEPDPVSEEFRPFIVFTAFEIQTNISKALDFSKENSAMEPKDSFVLPMPNGGLSDTVQNNYDTANSIAGNINKKLGSAANTIAQGATVGIVDNAVERMGMVPDPKLTNIYMGTGPRTWEGTWELVPQSAEEAEEIAKILKFIKKAAAPKKADIANKIGVLLQPWVFEITFSNEVIQKAMKFNKMALESYSINYFSQGYASTYSDSMPKQMSLSLKFKEYGIKTRSDWEEDE